MGLSELGLMGLKISLLSSEAKESLQEMGAYAAEGHHGRRGGRRGRRKRERKRAEERERKRYGERHKQIDR